MRLIAIKPNRYGTRHMVAGDEFEMPERYARTLLVTGLAKRAASVTDANHHRGYFVGESAITKLRKDAQSLGIIIDGRWGPRRLQSEIDRALKGS